MRDSRRSPAHAAVQAQVRPGAGSRQQGWERTEPAAALSLAASYPLQGSPAEPLFSQPQPLGLFWQELWGFSYLPINN